MSAANAIVAELLERVDALERQLARVVIRTRIAALDAAQARVRVVLAEAAAPGDDADPVLSGWLPWFAHRAGPDIAWHAPEVGEQALLLSPGGATEVGCVLVGLYQDAFPAPEDTETAALLRFADGSQIRYDRAAGLLECDWVGDVHQSVGGSVMQHVAGDVVSTIDGSLTATVSGGTDVTSPANRIDGPLHVTGKLNCDSAIESAVDCISAGVSGKGHTHPGDSGGTTGGPQ